MTKLIGKISYSSSSHTLEGSRLITLYYVNVTRLAQQGFRKLFSTKSGCGGRSEGRAFFVFLKRENSRDSVKELFEFEKLLYTVK